MQYKREGANGVITGYTRSQLNDLKSIPAKYEIVGKRFKFTVNDPSLHFLQRLGVKAVPTPTQTEVAVQRTGEFQYKTKPYGHQDKAFRETRDLEAYAFLWEMGLGKTKTALDTTAWMYQKGTIDALLVVTLNGVHRNWVEKEIPEHLPNGCNPLAIFWESSKGERKMLPLYEHLGLSIAAINIDSLGTQKGLAFCDAFCTRRKVLLALDEAHAAKNPSAVRTKGLLKIAPKTVARRIMTGTPITNSPSDAYTQYRFLKDDIWHPIQNFHQFRNHFNVLRDLPSNKFVKIEVRPRNIEQLQAIIMPLSSRLTKKDCLDLPEKIYRREVFEMTKEQKSLYAALVEKTKAEFQGKAVTPTIAITRLLRLHQIACGFVVPDLDGEAAFDTDRAVPLHEGAKNPRIEAMLRICDQAERKVIIWATYRFSIRQIIEALEHQYGKGCAVGYSGMTPQDARAKALQRFTSEHGPVRFFVAQPRAGGTGLTLNQATDTIYFSNDYSLHVRLQSEDRNHRIGQEYSVTYHDLEAAGTVDARIIDALRAKRSIANSITGDELVEWLE